MTTWPAHPPSQLHEKKACKEVDIDEELKVFRKYHQLRGSLDPSPLLKKQGLSSRNVAPTKKEGSFSQPASSSSFADVPPASLALNLNQLRSALTYVQMSLHHEPLLYQQDELGKAQETIDHAATTLIQMVRKINELETSLDKQLQKSEKIENLIKALQMQHNKLERQFLETSSTHSKDVCSLQKDHDYLKGLYEPLLQTHASLLQDVFKETTENAL